MSPSIRRTLCILLTASLAPSQSMAGPEPDRSISIEKKSLAAPERVRELSSRAGTAGSPESAKTFAARAFQGAKTAPPLTVEMEYLRDAVGSPADCWKPGSSPGLKPASAPPLPGGGLAAKAQKSAKADAKKGGAGCWTCAAGAMLGGLAGAAVGFLVGGPIGAIAGFLVGAVLGAIAGGLFKKK